MPGEPPQVSDDAITPDDPREATSSSAPEPRLIERFMAEFRGGMAEGSLFDRLSAGQVNKLLDQTNEESRRQHELDLQRNRMTFTLLLSLPIFVLLLCLVFLRYEKGDLLREIIALLIGLGGGGAGGYSLGRASSRRSHDP